jgi:hypothetical protein
MGIIPVQKDRSECILEIKNIIKIQFVAPHLTQVTKKVPENQRLSFIQLFQNRPSFNKSFNTSPRVSAILTPSHHAIAKGDGCFPRLPLAMLIPQLEGVLWCSVSL